VALKAIAGKYDSPISICTATIKVISLATDDAIYVLSHENACERAWHAVPAPFTQLKGTMILHTNAPHIKCNPRDGVVGCSRIPFHSAIVLCIQTPGIDSSFSFFFPLADTSLVLLKLVLSLGGVQILGVPKKQDGISARPQKYSKCQPLRQRKSPHTMLESELKTNPLPPRIMPHNRRSQEQ